MQKFTRRTQRGQPKRTKIICTLGPSSREEGMISSLIHAGMDVARINCSHGSEEEREELFYRIRKQAEKLDRSIAIMFDLSGPKIRIQGVKEEGLFLKPGDRLTIYREAPEQGGLWTTYEHFVSDLQEQEPIFLDDGKLRLEVEEKHENSLICKVKAGGQLLNRKGINLPGTKISAPSLTKKDRKDLTQGIALGADFFALSFVRSAQDIHELRKLLEEAGSKAGIVAKIEKPQAVAELGSIVKVSDAVMVARGDLGVELPVERVPSLQKEIILQCRRNLKPVIVATQMLESMVHSERPTRAEVSDVSNAIQDGCDALMLSGETANGEFPYQATETMARVARDAEKFLLSQERHTDFSHGSLGDPLRKAMVLGATRISKPLKAKFIVIRSETGETSRYLSHLRTPCPVIAVSPRAEMLRKHALFWGVIPLQTPQSEGNLTSMEEELDFLTRTLLKQNLVSGEDHIIVVSRYPWGEQLPPNSIRALRIDEVIPEA